MKLRSKMAVIVGSVLLGTALLLYAVFAFVLAQNVADNEAVTAHTNVDRAINAINYNLSQLNLIVSDWAAWDDTYRFMADKNSAYIKSNLIPDMFSGQALNIVALIDARGRLFWGKFTTLRGANELQPIPADVLSQVGGGSVLLKRLGNKNGDNVTAIVPTHEGPLLVAARPVLTSEGHGPARGAVVMARLLDAQEVARLAEIVQLPLAVQRLDASVLPADFRIALAEMDRGNRGSVLRSSESTMAGYGLLSDASGKPVVAVRVEMPRFAQIQAKGSARYVAISFAAIALLVTGSVLIVMDRTVLSRLAALSQSVKEVGHTRDLAARVSLPGPDANDELSSLAHEINAMLDALHDAQSALSESEIRYHAVVEQASDAIFLIDADTKEIVDANAVFVESFGFVGDAVAGPTLYDVTADDEASVDALVKDIVASGRHLIGETELVRRDGSMVDVEEVADVISFGGRDVICIVARDISQRKEMERMKEDFTAMISHELRSPLTVIIGFAAVLERLVERDGAESYKTPVDRIKSRAQDMVALVEELLNVAKIQAGGLALQPMDTDLGELVGRCVDGLPHSPGHTVKTTVEGTLPLVVCDPDRVSCAITNLVTNAIKYSPDGGDVDIVLSTQDSIVRVEVTDQGIGISDEDLPHVFERYTQGDMSATRTFGGVGLGLYVTREIVAAHGGRIDVKSELGRGSTFTIDLPVSSARTRARVRAMGASG